MGKKLNFDDIRNKEKGKIGLVCAAGSSLNKHITLFEDLSNNSKDDYCTICCNEYYEMSNLNPDYWVIANSVMTVANYSNHFNRSNSTLVYADTVDTTPKDLVDSRLTINYLPYDERHINHKPCGNRMSCCDKIQQDRLSIHEYLQKATGYDKRYNSAGTVAIHMIALAVILGCNPIYVSGVDMDYTKGYVRGARYSVPIGALKAHQQSFGESAEIISKSAEKIGIKIINLNLDAQYGGLTKGEFVEA